jgi:hypothetical protein
MREGRQLPKITMANAIQPRPPEISGTNSPAEARVRNAPPSPDIMPPNITARYWRTVMLRPRISTARGFSPMLRSSKPGLVRYKK